jgi:predicted TIM-barrel fold metal-dependent hydrolase
MFVSLDAMNKLEEGIAEIKELIENEAVLGIKMYPGYQDFDCTSNRLTPLYELAEKNNKPIAFHCGELHSCCPKDNREKKIYKCQGHCRIKELGHLSHPKNIAEAVKKFPKVSFILSHLGNPFFAELREVMKKYPNVYTDMSGQFLSQSYEDTPEYKKEISGEIRKFLELPGGIDRLMFGTDFPIQAYADSMALIKSLKLSKEEEEKIFFRNAVKLLNLQEV